MTKLPWPTEGVRLQRRDLEIAYVVARMVVVVVADIFFLFFGAFATARRGFERGERLGLLHALPRASVSDPNVYTVPERACAWVAEQLDCDVSELRTARTLLKLNLPATRMRNRFWASLAAACRRTSGISLARFAPERELRAQHGPGVPVVPDAQVVLAREGSEVEEGLVWFVEVDLSSERLATWRSKAKGYAACRDGRPFYGTTGGAWLVLALVPSVRRARGVASAVVEGGAGTFVFVAVAPSLERGCALDPVVWMAMEFAAEGEQAPRYSLGDALVTPISQPTQPACAGAAPGLRAETRVESRPSASGVIPE